MSKEYVVNSSGLMQRKYTDEDIETELENERIAVIQQKQQLENEIAQLQEESKSKIAAEELLLKQETIDAEKSIKDEEAENDLKRERALLAAKENEQKNMTVAQRMRRKQEEAQELQDKLDQLDAIRKAEGDLTDEQKEQYAKLIEDKKAKDTEYMEMKKTYFKYQTPQERLDAYKQEVKDIKEEAKEKRLQNDIDNADNPEEHAKRKKEIDKEEKEKTKEAQGAFGIGLGFGGGGGGNLIKSLSQGIGKAVTGGDAGGGIGDILNSVLGSGSPLMGAFGVALNIISSIFNALGSLNRLVGSGIEQAAKAESSYMGQINARLYGIESGAEDYYNKMISWSSEDGNFGLTIGQWNATADRQVYIQKLNELVQAGVVYNAEERALLSTISDRLVTTFDVMDSTLTRLVKIQQQDLTMNAMGSEALLTQFLNRQTWIKDTSYMTDAYDSISAILLDSMAKLSSYDAVGFNYEVQKWLASMYSLGLSQQGVEQLAQGINYLQTGDVNNLNSNQQLQYIYAAAADRAGLSLGDILVQGLDTETTNLLLQNVVTLLQDIYNNSTSNTVQSAWTSITGLSISDLKAITNLSSDYIASISSEHQDYVSSFQESTNQLKLLTDETRTSIAAAIDNIINNAMFDVGTKVMNSTTATIKKNAYSDEQYSILNTNWSLAGAINDALGIGGINKYVVYRVGQQLGGTIGTLVQSMVTIPAVVDSIKEFYKDYQKTNTEIFTAGTVGGDSHLADLYLIQEEANALAENNLSGMPLDRRFITNASPTYNILDSYEQVFMQYMSQIRDASQQVSDSYAIWDSQAIINRNEQLSELRDLYQNFLTLNGGAMQTAADLDYLTTYLDNTVSLAQQNSDAQIETLSSSLVTFQSQAQSIQETQLEIANQSEEDQHILEQADNISDYLFQNERTIRVTLVDTEERAREDLYSAISQDVVDKLLNIIGMMQTGVMVDVIDNDMNSLLGNIYAVKQS